MKVGNIGELATQLELAKRGYEIYTPAVDNATYDLLISKEGKIFKVEVKSTTVEKAGSWVVQIKKVRSNKNVNKVTKFDNSFVDFLAVYIVPTGEVHIIEAITITTKNELRIKK